MDKEKPPKLKPYWYYLRNPARPGHNIPFDHVKGVVEDPYKSQPDVDGRVRHIGQLPTGKWARVIVIEAVSAGNKVRRIFNAFLDRNFKP